MNLLKFILILLPIIQLTSCIKTKNNTMQAKTEKRNTQQNICSIKEQDLTLDIIKNQLEDINNNEICIEKITHWLLNNINNNPEKTLLVVEKMMEMYSEYEPFLDLANTLLEQYPKLVLEYLNQNPKSILLENLKDFHQFMISPEYSQKVLRNLKVNLNPYKNILKEINPEISFN